MTDKIFRKIGIRYPTTDLELGDYEYIQLHGAEIHIRAYKAKGLGHVSYCKSKGKFGLKKMDALIVSPYKKDLPLFILRRDRVLGKDVLCIELFDTILGDVSLKPLLKQKVAYFDLENIEPKHLWYDEMLQQESVYKTCGKKWRKRMDELAEGYFQAYLDLKIPGGADEKEKLKKNAAIVEGVLESGVCMADRFKKVIGEEKTAELYKKFIFGTEEV